MQTVSTDAMREAFRWAYLGAPEEAVGESIEMLDGMLHVDCSQWDRQEQPRRVMAVEETDFDRLRKERNQALRMKWLQESRADLRAEIAFADLRAEIAFKEYRLEMKRTSIKKSIGRIEREVQTWNQWVAELMADPQAAP